MTEHVKGYKATMPDGRPWYSPRSQPYVAGRAYSYNGDLELCMRGLHFCIDARDVYRPYIESYQTRVFEVTAYGHILSIDIKACANSLRIDRELSPKEILSFMAVTDDSYYQEAFFALLRTLLSDGNSSDMDYSDMVYTTATRAYLRRRKLCFIRAARTLARTDAKLRNVLALLGIALEGAIDD